MLLPAMKIRYDPDADAMYIKLVNRQIVKTKKVDDNTLIDFDSSGNVVGIELLFVSERNPALVNELKVERLLSA